MGTSVKKARNRLDEILKKCKNQNIDPWQLPALQKLKSDYLGVTWKFYFVLFAVVIALMGSYVLKYVNQGECLIEMPSTLSKAFRPPEDCNFCRGVTEVERVTNISPNEFEAKFAYSGIPVIVIDATQNWTALESFDFWYFKELYMNAKSKGKTLSCQFFPYKTNVKNLHEALSLPIERVNYGPGTDPWYFGWSNCNAEVAEVLRQHYGRPYFLPETSENNAVDWIFMGGPGLGAHMHVDNVRLPSWQAQLRGEKRWILAPPPECYFECNSFDTVVKKGEIIVLDTNKWYHQTMVSPGEVSITIGAEYD